MSKKTYIIEEEFQTPDGYTAIITFTRLGTRCGYILVPDDSPLAGKAYYDWDGAGEDLIQQKINNLEVHGGLTYASGGNDSLFKRQGWVFGFDAGHFDDGVDIEAVLKYDLDRTMLLALSTVLSESYGDKEIRTKAFIKAELLKLSKQIKKIEDEFKN